MKENQIPEVKKGFYLIGSPNEALVYASGRQVFDVILVPQSLVGVDDCRIYFDKEHIAEAKINIKGCMLLVWARDKYFYEPAPFKKTGDEYVLRLDRYLAGKSFEKPKLYFKSPYFAGSLDNSRFSDRRKKQIYEYVTDVQPGKGGAAYRIGKYWDILIEKKRFLFPARRYISIFFGSNDECIQGYGPQIMAAAAWKVIGNTNKISKEEYEREAEALQKVYDMCLDHCDEYTEEKLEQYDEIHREYQLEKLFAQLQEQEKEMEQEIKERFEMLEDMGLSIEFEKRFLETKKVPYGMGVRGRWLDDSIRDRRVQGFANEFNEMFQVKAYYYGTVDYQEVQYEYLMFVSRDQSNWEQEKRTLKNGNAIVYLKKKFSKQYGLFVPVTFKIERNRIFVQSLFL